MNQTNTQDLKPNLSLSVENLATLALLKNGEYELLVVDGEYLITPKNGRAFVASPERVVVQAPVANPRPRSKWAPNVKQKLDGNVDWDNTLFTAEGRTDTVRGWALYKDLNLNTLKSRLIVSKGYITATTFADPAPRGARSHRRHKKAA